MALNWRLAELRIEATKATGHKPSYADIKKATGVSAGALHKMENNESQRTDLHVIDRLLIYFQEVIGRELTTQDLLEFR